MKEDKKACFVCEAVRLSLKNIERTDSTSEEFKPLLGEVFIAGFAIGFNLRRQTSYMEACQRHRDALSAALQASGSRPVSVAPKPEGSS